MNKLYVIYDERANYKDTEDCNIFETCDTLQEAKKSVKQMD